MRRTQAERLVFALCLISVPLLCHGIRRRRSCGSGNSSRTFTGGERRADQPSELALRQPSLRKRRKGPRRPHFGYTPLKRTMDVTLGLLLGLSAAPLIVLAALAVLVTSPGNPFFVQTRIGQGGREFRLFKIRTMIPNADRMVPHELNETNGPTFKAAHDPRLLPVGRWLRKTSVDELPQLLNVVLGDLSLVGPRPALPSEVNGYGPSARARLAVKPGLTAIWQVSGRSDVPFPTMVAMDRLYIRKRALWFDLWLLARTPLAVLSMRGAR